MNHLLTELLSFTILFPFFMMAVIIHEVSHGWVALKLGDSTALRAGRLTLNPFKHMDLIGTILLPIFLLMVQSPFIFGWAKPVPINPLGLRHPKQDILWVGIAGPISNFVFAAGIALFLKGWGNGCPALISSLAKALIFMNLVLGSFNLIPIPPLDGSRILLGIAPLPLARRLVLLERWGIVIMLLLLYCGVMERVIWPMVAFFSRMLGIS